MKTIVILLLVQSMLCLSGCGTVSKPKTLQPENNNNIKTDKVSVEAYLFDTKLKQHGKPTSVRLFFFQTDSIIAIGGKGYLGKGALKGWMTNDSILITFPTLNEYLYESVDNLFASFDCTGQVPKINMMALFTTLPDALFDVQNSVVTKLNDNKKRPEFSISFVDCLWTINITYDLKKNGYRIRKFYFDDGTGTTLSGKRREYKENSKVNNKQFESKINSSMSRIIP